MGEREGLVGDAGLIIRSSDSRGASVGIKPGTAPTVYNPVGMPKPSALVDTRVRGEGNATRAFEDRHASTPAYIEAAIKKRLSL